MNRMWGIKNDDTQIEIQLIDKSTMTYGVLIYKYNSTQFQFELNYKELQELERLLTEDVEYNPERSAK